MKKLWILFWSGVGVFLMLTAFSCAAGDKARSLMGASADSLAGSEEPETATADPAPADGDGRWESHKSLKEFATGTAGPAGTQSTSSATGKSTLDLGLDVGEELWVIARAPAGQAATDDDRPERGELRTVGEDGREVPLPLEQTDVVARVSAYISAVEVRQRYHNPFERKIETTYVFPLPQSSAVSEFVMTIGERRIRGIIREREEAEQIYQEAKAAGHVASLLTQERPNVFTQKVANIEPGKRIDVELVYYATLPYRDGGYELVFPLTVGPRYNPPGSTEGVGAVPRGASGASGQATEVQYLAPGERSGHDVSLIVELDAGVEVLDVKSPSHDIDAETLSPNRRRIALARHDSLPDKDFVLRWTVASDAVKPGLLLHRDARGGFFTLVLEPPADLGQVGRAPVEMIFVLDCSGSMNGIPLKKAKRAVRRVLERLSPRDTFQIIRFSSNASSLGETPVAASKKNVRRGLDYLDDLEGTGGTAMIEGIKAALDFPHEPGRVRLVSFMTDGFIGNESQILGAIHEKLGASRIFSFGVGSSPNRYLLERMAKVGRGAVAYVGLDDDAADEAVDAFYQRIAHPALSDIEVDWHGSRVSEVYPSRLPDLHVGRPVVITGRLEGDLGDRVTVHGRLEGRPVSHVVPVADLGSLDRPAVAQVWARMKIMDLVDRTAWQTPVAPLVDEIKSVALTYGLMSKWTAFVAVDSRSQTGGDAAEPVMQPAMVPAGVRHDTTVGAPAGVR